MKPMPAPEAFKFFLAKRKKGMKGFDYRDIESRAHAVAFTAAKAMKQDVLDTLYTGLQETMRRNGTVQDFKKAVTQELKAQGWWGKKAMVDPVTGKVVDAQLGSSRRLEIIFNTNIRSAFSAGQWAGIQHLEKQGETIYLEYQAVNDSKTRDNHLSKDNLILPATDPFWDQWFPPNGWRCRCTVNELTEDTMAIEGLKPSKRPQIPNRNVLNKRTGEVTSVPVGLDPNFASNIGKSWLEPFVPKMAEYTVLGNAPKVRRFFLKNNTDILPSDKTPEFYAMAFLRQFGIRKLDEETAFTDKTGVNIAISKALLIDKKSGKLKTDKKGRGPYMMLLASTLQDPDEIWKLYDPRTKQIKRHYIKEHKTPKGEIYGFSAFAWDRKNKTWSGKTTFQVDDTHKDWYIQKQQKSKLLYRKEKPSEG